MKKLATKLMISVLSVALAFIALGTSTFAWFSMNTTVEATGMQLTAVTPINLLIGDKETTPADFKNTVAANESFTGKLYPASSADAKLFNAIMNTGNYIGEGEGGVADNNTKFQKSSAQTGTKVIAMNGAGDGYWADYTFQLKLSEAQAAPVNVYLSTLKFYQKYTTPAEGSFTAGDNYANYYTIVNGAYTNCGFEGASDVLANSKEYFILGGIANACRAALFVGDVAGGAIDLSTATMKALYSNAADTANAITTDVAADYTPLNDGANPALTTAATASVVPADEAAYRFQVNDVAVNVLLRVWVEGQDTNCVNAVAGQQFAIQLGFQVHQD